MPFYGVLLILVGIGAAVMPYVGQAVGLDVAADPFTDGQMLRHGLPAVAIVLGGLLLLPPLRALRILGGVVAAAGGIWLVLAPSVLGWMTGELMRAEAAWALGAYYGPGVIATLLAGIAVGAGFGTWIGARRALAPPEEEVVREERYAEEEAAYGDRYEERDVAADPAQDTRRMDPADHPDHEPAYDETPGDAYVEDDRRDHDTTGVRSEPTSDVEPPPRGEPAQDPEDVTRGG